jgi:hypothetical protein
LSGVHCRCPRTGRRRFRRSRKDVLPTGSVVAEAGGRRAPGAVASHGATDQPGFWERCGYDNDADYQTKERHGL